MKPRLLDIQSVNEMVTKMVANSGPWAGIERQATTHAAIIPNTNQHFEGQNETGRNGHQQILSQARLPIPPHGLWAVLCVRPEQHEKISTISISYALIIAEKASDIIRNRTPLPAENDA